MSDNTRIRVPPELHQQLKVEAAKRGVTVATLAKLAIERYLQETRG